MTAIHETTRRETNRRALADLLDRHPDALADTTGLVDGLNLDSLAMMTVLAWLHERGVVVADDAARPGTVGEVLALLDRPPGLPRMTVTVGGAEFGPAPTDLPRLPVPTDPLVPVLDSGAFRLSPVQPGDTEFLYWLSIQPETCFRWRYRGAPPSYERFTADLWSRVLVQFVVHRGESGEPVGHVVGYAADSGMRHAYVGAVFTPQHAGNGFAAQAVATFARYLFHTFPLHKLYLEVPGFNWPQLVSGEGSLFEVEGLLRGHDFYAGEYWDKRICAIYAMVPGTGQPGSRPVAPIRFSASVNSSRSRSCTTGTGCGVGVEPAMTSACSRRSSSPGTTPSSAPSRRSTSW